MEGDLTRLFLLRNDTAFLNHGSYGACPKRVFDAYQAFQLELEHQPVEFLTRRLAGLMQETRVALSEELGTSPDNIVGMTNVTMGLNVVAQSLELRPGDQILTTNHEYAAIEKTWAYVARRTGAEIVVVDIPLPLVSESQFNDAILAGMTERTRVLFVSHITSPTALVFPIADAIAVARRQGIYSVIDGAHAPGHIPLNLDVLGADFYAGNCHKWLMAPKGSAFLYARSELQNILNPLVISHGWTAESKLSGARGAFGNSPFIDEMEVQGTRDPAAWLALPTALTFRLENDWAEVASQCQLLALDTARRLACCTGLAPLSAPVFCAPQMVAMPIPECDPMVLQRTLNERYHIEIPIFKWEHHHIVRLSVQGYNSRQQMNLLIEALADLLGIPETETVMPLR